MAFSSLIELTKGSSSRLGANSRRTVNRAAGARSQFRLQVWQADPVAKPPVMQPTSADVGAFLDAVPNETRRGDAKVLCKLLGDITGEPPVLWGPSIVGFGIWHYRYESAREGAMPLAGFSPRKAHLVVNLLNGFEERDQELMAKLGTYKTGVSKLYIKALANIDLNVLRELVERSVRISSDPDRATRLMRPH